MPYAALWVTGKSKTNFHVFSLSIFSPSLAKPIITTITITPPPKKIRGGKKTRENGLFLGNSISQQSSQQYFHFLRYLSVLRT